MFNCKTCNKEFKSKKACKSRTPKYCSKECFAESLRMHKKCILCGNEIINKNSASLKHRKYCSYECSIKSKKGGTLTIKHKKALSEGRKKSIKCKGENLYNWKGGESTYRERLIDYRHRRRSLQNLKIDTNYLKKLLVVQKNKCFYCEYDLTEYKAVEHLTPLSRGGDNQNWNLVYSCQKCNARKRTKTLEEYAIKHELYHLITKFDIIYANAIS